MPKLSEVLTTAGEGLAGGLLLGADKFGKRVTEDITEERRLPLRTEVAGRLGLVPDSASKIKTELDTLKGLKLSGYLKSKAEPTATAEPVKNIATFNRLVGLVSTNKAGLVSKGYSESKISEVIRSLQDGVVDKTAQNLLNAIPLKGTSVYEIYKDELETTPKAQVSTFSEEQKRAFKDEYNSRVKELTIEYNKVLHEELPYYKDLLALLQLEAKSRKSEGKLDTSRLYPGTLIKGNVDGWSETIQKGMPQLKEGENFGMTNKQVVQQVTDIYTAVQNQLDTLIQDGRVLSKKNHTDTEAYPYLKSTAKIINLIPSMMTETRGGISNGITTGSIGEDKESRGVIFDYENKATLLNNIDGASSKLANLKMKEIYDVMVSEKPQLKNRILSYVKENESEWRVLFESSYKAYLLRQAEKDGFEQFWNALETKRYYKSPTTRRQAIEVQKAIGREKGRKEKEEQEKKDTRTTIQKIKGIFK